MPDYYSILQVSPEAEPEVIKLAYKALAKKYHPDRCSEPDREARMQRINEAYEVLRDPARRAGYDRSRPGPELPPPVRDPKPRPATVDKPSPVPGADPERARLRLAQLFLGSVLLLVGYFGLQALWGLHSRGQAQERFEQGDFQGCLQLLNQTIQSGSRDGDSFLLRARCYNQLEQPEPALVDLDNAAALGADRGVVGLERARALSSLDRPEEALAALEGLKGDGAEAMRESLRSQLRRKELDPDPE